MINITRFDTGQPASRMFDTRVSTPVRPTKRILVPGEYNVPKPGIYPRIGMTNTPRYPREYTPNHTHPCTFNIAWPSLLRATACQRHIVVLSNTDLPCIAQNSFLLSYPSALARLLPPPLRKCTLSIKSPKLYTYSTRKEILIPQGYYAPTTFVDR